MEGVLKCGKISRPCLSINPPRAFRFVGPERPLKKDTGFSSFFPHCRGIDFEEDPTLMIRGRYLPGPHAQPLNTP